MLIVHVLAFDAILAEANGSWVAEGDFEILSGRSRNAQDDNGGVEAKLEWESRNAKFESEVCRSRRFDFALRSFTFFTTQADAFAGAKAEGKIGLLRSE
jgi:hypothetical protein